MLSTRRCGWSLLGRLFCSARHCKAWAYATVFSLGISQMSWQAKVDMMGGMNICWWRHGGARGTWNGASLGSSSCIHLGSWNKALTSQASLPVSSCGTVDNSGHQLGTSHFSAFHHTHLADLYTDGSGSISSPSSSAISDDPCKKEATFTLSCSGSPKSESLPLDPILPEGVSGLADWLAVGWLEKLTRRHLFLLLSSGPWLSLSHLTLFRTRMGLHLLQPFDLLFQSHSSWQGFLMCLMHSSQASVQQTLPLQSRWLASGWVKVFGIRAAFFLQWVARESRWYLPQNGQFSWWRTG